MREFDGEVLGFARPMKREQTALGGVLLSALVFVAGQGLIGTLVGVSAHDHGFSNAVIGLIGSAYYVGFIAGCWCGPAAILRFGHQTIFMAILLFAAVIMSVFAFWAVPSAWIAARAALGFIAAIAYTLIESWLNHLAVNRNRGRVFGSYLLIKQLGSSLGQTIILLANVVPWAMFAAAALLFAIAWIPIRAASPPVPSIAPERTRPRPIELLLAAPIGTLICAAADWRMARSGLFRRYSASRMASRAPSPARSWARSSWAAPSSNIRWAGSRTAWTAARSWSAQAWRRRLSVRGSQR
jgi:MFS family permease